MNIYAWILIVWVFLAMLWIVSQVGKPRPTLDTRDAVYGIFFCALQAWLVYMAAVN